METALPILKLTQNCWLHYNINIVNHKFAPSFWHHTSWWETIWQNMNFLMNWWKFECAIWAIQKSKFSSLLWTGKNLKVYTAQDQHFKIQILNLWINWEKLCPNFSFTVENKMGNSHKKVWSHKKVLFLVFTIIFLFLRTLLIPPYHAS